MISHGRFFYFVANEIHTQVSRSSYLQNRVYCKSMKKLFGTMVGIMMLVWAQTAHAQSLVTLPSCTADGNCQLNDVVNTGISVVQFILGISGSVALLMFIYGGFLWVTSAGNSEKVNQGKSAVTNAVIGLVIVFVSYTAVVYGLQAFGVGSQFNPLGGTKSTELEVQK